MSSALLLSCCPDYAWLQEKERKKGSPYPSWGWQAPLVWQAEKTEEWGSFRFYTSSLFSLGSRQGGEDGCLQVSCPSCSSVIWPWQKWEFHGDDWSPVENLAHCCCAAVCPSPPTPNIQYFLISEKQVVGSWAAAELLYCQRASQCSNLFLLVVSSVSEYKAKKGIWLLACILPRPQPAFMDAGYLWNRVQCNMYTSAKSGPYAVQEKLALDCRAKKAICLSYLEYCTVFASWIKPIAFLWTESFWQQSLNYEWQEPFSLFLTSNPWCIT